MKTIIITGATGFIGVHLIEEWLKKDSEIYAVVRPDSKNLYRIPENKHIHIVELDMNEYHKLPTIVDHADCFYHLAWEGARIPFRDDATIQGENYKCALGAFKAAVKLGCDCFIGAGSQAEYGFTDGIVHECYTCKPVTEYGKQKLNAGRTILQQSKSLNIRCIWLRIFSLYGPYDYSNSLIMHSIKKMLDNEPIEMTEGIQLWDYLYVADAAKAMLVLYEKKCESGIYNIASGEHKPLREFIEDIKEVIESSSELRFGVIPYGDKGPLNLTPCCEKLKESTGWHADTDFRLGIRRVIENMHS